MPIRDLLNNDIAFTPEEANVLIDAFEQTLKELQLVNRDDPATLLVADRIIEIAKTGERDPQQLRLVVLASFGATAKMGSPSKNGHGRR
jgi:hypothetical protein